MFALWYHIHTQKVVGKEVISICVLFNLLITSFPCVYRYPWFYLNVLCISGLWLCPRCKSFFGSVIGFLHWMIYFDFMIYKFRIWYICGWMGGFQIDNILFFFHYYIYYFNFIFFIFHLPIYQLFISIVWLFSISK